MPRPIKRHTSRRVTRTRTLRATPAPCAAAIRTELGREHVGRLYQAIGKRAFETSARADHSDPGYPGTAEFLSPVLCYLGLPQLFVEVLDDGTLDEALRAETDGALALTGKDVGTPILHFDPPRGTAFFGPVISRLPDDDQALELWDHVIALARFPGFAELKRSLREQPQLASFGVATAEVGIEEDWRAGSRRQEK